MKGKRKPLEIEKLQGNPGRRPLKVAPKTEIIQDKEPPEYMTDGAKKEWKRIIKIYKTIGMITESDLKGLESLCNLADRLEWVTKQTTELIELYEVIDDLSMKVKIGDILKNMMNYELKYSAQLKVMCGEFGFSPAARSRVGIKPEKPKEKNEIEDFLNRECKIT